MTFWISFPFWMMLLLLVVNSFLVARFSANIHDDEGDVNPNAH